MENSDIIRKLETAADAPADPFLLFAQWLEQAQLHDPIDYNAMCLATADAGGAPDARIVLLKEHGPHGFTFYTNLESAKSRQLKENPRAALCFFWRPLDSQIRITGNVAEITPAESDAYFFTRNRGSRLGAWASRQSKHLENRSTLAARVREMDQKFTGTDVPRPSHWGGWRLMPERMEFWHEGADRLHTRLLYTRTPQGWNRTLLYP